MAEGGVTTVAAAPAPATASIDKTTYAGADAAAVALPKRQQRRQRNRGGGGTRKENERPEEGGGAAAASEASADAKAGVALKTLLGVVNETQPSTGKSEGSSSGAIAKVAAATGSKAAGDQKQQAAAAGAHDDGEGEWIESGKKKKGGKDKEEKKEGGKPQQAKQQQDHHQQQQQRGQRGADKDRKMKGGSAGGKPVNNAGAGQGKPQQAQGQQGKGAAGGKGKERTNPNPNPNGSSNNKPASASAPIRPPAPPQPTPEEVAAAAERARRHLASLSLLGTAVGAAAVVECLPVPKGLHEWVDRHPGEVASVLAGVKGKSGAMSVVLDRGVGTQEIMVTALGAEEARKARALLEVHLKNLETLARAERRMLQVQEDITAVQGAVAAGLRIEFQVHPDLTGIVIGKKGERIKRVYEATGVTKIDVTDQGVVRIAGPTNGAVLQAREMLELMQEDIPVAPAAFQWLSRPMLQDVRDKSEAAAVRAPPETPHSVRVIGTRKQVESAKLLLETQLEYIERHQRLRASEDAMRRQLYEIDARAFISPSSASALAAHQQQRDAEFPPLGGGRPQQGQGQQQPWNNNSNNGGSGGKGPNGGNNNNRGPAAAAAAGGRNDRGVAGGSRPPQQGRQQQQGQGQQGHQQGRKGMTLRDAAVARTGPNGGEGGKKKDRRATKA